MFTGIVTAVGRVSAVARNGGKGRGRGNGEGVNGLLLTIRAPYKGLKPGESIAVNGACLTVERVVRGGFTVHAVETTTGRTLLGRSEEHTSELQSLAYLVCRLLLEKKKKNTKALSVDTHIHTH